MTLLRNDLLAVFGKGQQFGLQLGGARTVNRRDIDDLGFVWESNVIRDGISRTYEEHGGAKNRIKNSKELLLFPDLFPRFRERVEISNRGKQTYTLTRIVAEGYKFSGTDGKPTINHHFPSMQCQRLSVSRDRQRRG